MTIFALNVDNKAQKMIENVESVYASIAAAYQLPYVKTQHHGSSKWFEFGATPAMGNFVNFTSSAGKVTATLIVNKTSERLLKDVFGEGSRAIVEHSAQTRKSQGNDVANALPTSKYQSYLDQYFGVGIVSMTIHESGYQNIVFNINIEDLNEKTIRAISTILMETDLIPKAQNVRQYNL